MDLISGKTAMMGGMGFLLGSGFSLFQSCDDWVRSRRRRTVAGNGGTTTALSDGVGSLSVRPIPAATPAVRLALSEGWRAAKLSGSAALVIGIIGVARHGRYSDKLYALRRDPIASGGGAAAAVAVLADGVRHRFAIAAASGIAVSAVLAWITRNDK